MMDFLDIYEKNVKPTMEPVVEEPQKDENELFEVKEEPEQKPPTFSGIDEDALIEKISSRILESLNIKKEDG